MNVMGWQEKGDRDLLRICSEFGLWEREKERQAYLKKTKGGNRKWPGQAGAVTHSVHGGKVGDHYAQRVPEGTLSHQLLISSSYNEAAEEL